MNICELCEKKKISNRYYHLKCFKKYEKFKMATKHLDDVELLDKLWRRFYNGDYLNLKG